MFIFSGIKNTRILLMCPSMMVECAMLIFFCSFQQRGMMKCNGFRMVESLFILFIWCEQFIFEVCSIYKLRFGYYFWVVRIRICICNRIRNRIRNRNHNRTYTSITLILKAHYSRYKWFMCLRSSLHLQQMASLSWKFRTNQNSTSTELDVSFICTNHASIAEKMTFHLQCTHMRVKQVISLETVIMSRRALSIVYPLQKWIPLYIRFTLNIWIGKQIDAPLKLSTAAQAEEQPPAYKHTHIYIHTNTNTHTFTLQPEHFHTEETIKCHIDTFCITNRFIPSPHAVQHPAFKQSVTFLTHWQYCLFDEIYV